MASGTITGGATAVTSLSSTYAQAIIKSTVVNSANLSTAAAITVSGGSYSSSVAGAAIIANDTNAVTLIGSAANNQLIVGADAANTVLYAGTGTGQTIVGGNVGTLIGTSTTSGGTALIVGGNLNDTVYAGAGNNTIAAGAGNNAVVLAGGNNIVASSGASDTVFASAGNNTISAGSGNGLIGLVGGSNTVIGGSGNSTVIGATSTGNLLIGNSATTGGAFLVGGSGNDTIYAGKSVTGMIGGAGTDFFVFSTVYGGSSSKAVIGDFKSGTDYLAFQGYTGITAASIAANAATTSAGAVISLSDGTTILVAGVSSLKASDILVG